MQWLSIHLTSCLWFTRTSLFTKICNWWLITRCAGQLNTRFWTKPTKINELTKDFVNGVVWWQRTVEDTELSFEPLRNVVPAATRVDHGSDELEVDNGDEVSRLVQAVHTVHLHHLASDLVGHLEEVRLFTYSVLITSKWVYPFETDFNKNKDTYLYYAVLFKVVFFFTCTVSQVIVNMPWNTLHKK